MKKYNITYIEKVYISKIWLCREGLQFMETLTTEEQEACKGSTALFQMLNKRFKLEHNETVLSFQ